MKSITKKLDIAATHSNVKNHTKIYTNRAEIVTYIKMRPKENYSEF
jgi:hypothetical protein